MPIQERIKNSIERGKITELSAFSGFQKRMKEMVKEEIERYKNEITLELHAILEEKIREQGITTIKGDRGHTPQKGFDYFTGEEIRLIKDELRPVKGKDYFDGLAGKHGRDGKSISNNEIQNIIIRILSKRKSSFDPNKTAGEIARALEKLQGSMRLDYEALKNRPGIPMFDKRGVRGAIRGGGDLVQISDLSGSLDGSTSTFTVPSHTKALMLIGTQAPLVYRPTTDFTTLGTTLTLVTAQVSAPQTGQTLLFLYTF